MRKKQKKCFRCGKRGTIFVDCKTCAAQRERIGEIFVGARAVPIDIWADVDPNGNSQGRGGYDIWLDADRRPALLTFNPKHRAEAMTLVGRIVDHIGGAA